MSFIWLIVWLDYGTPPLHHSGWLFTMVLAIIVDLLLKSAASDG